MCIYIGQQNLFVTRLRPHRFKTYCYLLISLLVYITSNPPLTPSPPLQKTAVCPPASLRGVLALCLQTDKEQRDLVFWSDLRAQRLRPDSRWLMEAQRKGPLRNRETLKERSAQKDSRLTIGWLNAKLRASNKDCGFTRQWRCSSEGQTYMYTNRYTHRPEPQPSGTSFTQQRGVDSLTPAHGAVMVCQGRQTYGDLNAGPFDWQSSSKKSKKAVLWD